LRSTTTDKPEISVRQLTTISPVEKIRVALARLED